MRKVITEMCHARYPVKLDIYLYLKTTNFPGFFGGVFYEKKKILWFIGALLIICNLLRI